MKGDAIRLAQASAQIQTVAAAVGALDAATLQLNIADQAIDLVPAGYASKDSFAATFSFLLGSTQDVQAELRASVQQARDEIAKYRADYNGYFGDDLAQEISTAHSMGIASTLQYANKVCNNAIDEIGDGPTIGLLDFVGGVEQAITAAVQFVATTAGDAAKSIVQGAANVTAGVVSALWVPIVVVGGAVALVVAYQKGWLKRIA